MTVLDWVAAPFAAKKRAVAPKRAATEVSMFKDDSNGNGNGAGEPDAKVSNKLNTFVRRLDYLIKGGSQTKRMKITPDQAQAILDKWNDRNRHVSPTKVRQYAEAMAEGRWYYTGEPISFSTKRLLNGQHRLHGCVSSGKPIDVLLVFGVPDESFAHIDVGKTRTAGDVFSIHGVENANNVAAATKFVLAYEDGYISTQGGGYPVDHAELYEFFLEHPKLPKSVWVAHAFAKSRLAPPSTMLAIHYLCARKAQREADAFFAKVGEGLGFTGKKDPAYRLHKRLMDNIISQEKLGRRQLAALTVKAWNANRLGREVGTLKYSADEAFPKVV